MGATGVLPGSSPVKSETVTYGIYLVLTDAERMVVIARSAIEAGDLFPSSEVGRIGTFDPGMTGAQMVAHSPSYPVLVREAR